MKNVSGIGELLIDFVAEKQEVDLQKANIFTKKLVVALQNVASAIAKLSVKFFLWLCGQDPLALFLIKPP